MADLLDLQVGRSSRPSDLRVQAQELSGLKEKTGGGYVVLVFKVKTLDEIMEEVSGD